MAIVQAEAKGQRWAQSVRESVATGKLIEKAAKQAGVNVSQLIRIGIFRVLGTPPTTDEILKTATRPGPKGDSYRKPASAAAADKKKGPLKAGKDDKGKKPQFAKPQGAKKAAGKPEGGKMPKKSAGDKPKGKKAAKKPASGKQMEFPPLHTQVPAPAV